MSAASTIASAAPPPQKFLLRERILSGPVFSVAVTETTIYVGHHNGIIVGVPINGSSDDGAAGDLLEMAAHNGVVRQISVFGQRLFSCSSDGSIKCWKLPECPWEMSYEGHQAPVNCFTIDEKQNRLYSGDELGNVNVWDIATGQCTQSMRCHVGSVSALCIPLMPPPKEDGEDMGEPPRPNCILTGSSDSLVKFIEPSTKLVHVLIKAEKPVCSIHYMHPIVLVGGSDGVIRGYNIHTANGAAIFRAHSDGINRMLTVKGRLLSASDDMTLMLWNMRAWSPDVVFTGHQRCVSCAALDTTESVLFSCGFDGCLKTWDIKSAVESAVSTAGPSTMAPPKKKTDAKKKKK